MDSIYLRIPELPAGRIFALATLIETKGSTPRKAGSSALFDSSGLLAGTIGGGILEGKVQKLALGCVVTGKSGIYHFDLDYDISHKQDAICGGKATVLLEIFTKNADTVFDKLQRSLSERTPGILLTYISGAEETNVKIERFWVTKNEKYNLPYSDFIKNDVDELLSFSAPGDFVEKEFSPRENDEVIRALLEPLFPSFRLIIAGAGHIGRSLAHLGKLLDFEVTIIDDRAEYANRQNIPDADHIVVDDIGLALKNISIRSDTYIVIVTRGHNDDAVALRSCIGSGAAYIGMIGSRTKIAQMHSSFIENGWANESQWEEVHAPIGLAISSQTVQEIAVSIAAQLVMVKNVKKDQ